MKARVVFFPYSELRVCSHDDLIWVEFGGGEVSVFVAFFVKRIWHCERVFLSQSPITILGINQEKGRARGRSELGDHVDRCRGFAAAARGGDEVEHAVTEIGRA